MASRGIRDRSRPSSRGTFTGSGQSNKRVRNPLAFVRVGSSGRVAGIRGLRRRRDTLLAQEPQLFIRNEPTAARKTGTQRIIFQPKEPCPRSGGRRSARRRPCACTRPFRLVQGPRRGDRSARCSAVATKGLQWAHGNTLTAASDPCGTACPPQPCRAPRARIGVCWTCRVPPRLQPDGRRAVRTGLHGG
jgi:hypothetical protein